MSGQARRQEGRARCNVIAADHPRIEPPGPRIGENTATRYGHAVAAVSKYEAYSISYPLDREDATMHVERCGTLLLTDMLPRDA